MELNTSLRFGVDDAVMPRGEGITISTSKEEETGRSVTPGAAGKGAVAARYSIHKTVVGWRR